MIIVLICVHYIDTHEMDIIIGMAKFWITTYGAYPIDST